MKAIVSDFKGGLPAYQDVIDPVATNENEILVDVIAVAITNYDKARASGVHYSIGQNMGAAVIGADCMCLLPDGTKVYAMGINGTLAEKALIDSRRMISVPAGLDDRYAAALPNAVIGAAMGLRFKADMQAGDVVLINGATGFTGRVAVQLAKYYGAAKIIVTGRNRESLDDLKTLGADHTICLLDKEEAILDELTRIHRDSPFNVVIDYLWGNSAELIISCLKGNGAFTPKTNFVSVGSMAGDTITLSSAALRSVNFSLSGSGIGAWTKLQVQHLLSDILPDAFELALHGKIVVDTIPVKLQDIAAEWDSPLPDGHRVVVMTNHPSIACF